ncbi:hypothetical protein GCM10009839_61050 [Catenulispora yoronensis]|uniref:Gram-positive cocci surface proteins LPxTG domain-containing protein n=1 Tax=Catenulispora yoronensis TaxID=450799 RepID=A0ABN2V0R5_9ACTN
MTSTKARGAGLGAVATFAGFAASLSAGTAHADAPVVYHPRDAAKTCTIGRDDVEFTALDKAGRPTTWLPASYHNLGTEPAYGFQVRLKDEAKECDGSIAVSLASYLAEGPDWKGSGPQRFLAYATTTLKKGQDVQTLTVSLPGTDGKKVACFGQLDLYFGTTIFDGQQKEGHGPLPENDDKKVVASPNPHDLIAGWNGGETKCETAPPPVTPPTSPPSTPPVSPPQSPPVTPPAAPPSTPPVSPPAPPVKPTSTPPTTPSTSTPPPASPGTPTLAHTGSDAGALSLVALTFFGAGGGAIAFSRKAGARKH